MSFLVCVAWVAKGNGFSRTICKRQCGAPSCGVHVRLPPVGHRRGNAVRQPQHLRRPIHHVHRMRRRFRPQPRKARFLPSKRRSLLWGHTQILQSCPVSETHCRGKENSKSSPNLHAEPGKSPDARVAEAQARVSRLQAAVDLLGVDNPDAELLKASLETAKRQCRVQPVKEQLDSCPKFVERGERQKRIVHSWPQGCNLERLRAEARACPVPPTNRSETTELRELRLEIEERTEPMDGED